MRVLITTVEPSLDSELERKFWRAKYFVIADTDTLEWTAVPNPGAPTAHAAGTRGGGASECVVRVRRGTAGTRGGLLAINQQIDATISGDYGPNCYVVLESAGIPMYQCGQCKTARDAVQAFRTGHLQVVYGPTVSQAEFEKAAAE